MKPVYLIAVACVLGWLAFQTLQPQRLDPNAIPRTVAARGDLASDEQNTIDIFRNSAPSVAYITSIAVRRDFFSLNAYEIPQGTGSGFIWDKQGRIVTNYHVISDANRLEVTLADHSSWKAVLVGAAPDRDLAVLQINAPADKLRPISLGESKNLLVGQKVFAIGNPFGLDQTLTTGVVSALGREIKAVTGRTIHDVIQTDAAINPGNSGGPLLDSAGRLIGVNTAIYSPSGASSGIGFAVPVGEVNRVVPQIISKGKLIRPGLGITLANRRLTEELGLEGVMVLKVLPGSTASKAGLRGATQVREGLVLGDIILAVNGKAIQDYDSLRDELERHAVGEQVTLTVMRDSADVELQVQLEAMN
ncbi:MAG: trypsin-like peptidase domain-containing protein [Desulfobulbus sp.]|nr:trypsin-like peptidase domain-containing protein [Desulfobulbus sp.]